MGRFAKVDFILEAVLREKGLESVWQLAQIHKYWFYIIDVPTVDKIRPYKLQRRVLTLRVLDGAYSAVFHYKKKKMIEKINQLDEQIKLVDIRFEVGPVVHPLWQAGREKREQIAGVFKEMDLLQLQLQQKRGVMSDEVAFKVAEAFFAHKNDYVDLVLVDGTEVKRHQGDQQMSSKKSVRPTGVAVQKAKKVGNMIQDERIRKKFIKALAASFTQKSRLS